MIFISITLNSFAPNTQIVSSEVNQNFTNIVAKVKPTYVWSVAGILFVEASPVNAYIVPFDMAIDKCWLYATTAPTGADLIIDINRNDVTIWSTQANRAKITAGNQTGNTIAFNTTALTAGDILTLDIDQIGSTVAGADLVVELQCS